MMKKSRIIIFFSGCVLTCLVMIGLYFIIKGAPYPRAGIVTIGENTYNLSDDFQDVISQMLNNDICVADYRGRIYSEDGDYSEEIYRCDKDYDNVVWVELFNSDLYEAVSDGVCYEFNARLCEYENKEGISELSEQEDYEKLKNYYSYRGSYSSEDDGYIAVYFDGKPVDFSLYLDTVEDFLDKYPDGPSSIRLAILNSHLINFLYYDDQSFEDLDYDTQSDYLQEIAATNAVLDGLEKIDSSEISNVYVVWYTYPDKYPELIILKF